MATAMGLGVVPVRKAGKLPGVTIGVDYELEYGVDRLELHEGAVLPGHRVVLVDDLLATGGTILATAALMRSAGAEVAAALLDRKSTRLNSSHYCASRMPSSA